MYELSYQGTQKSIAKKHESKAETLQPIIVHDEEKIDEEIKENVHMNDLISLLEKNNLRNLIKEKEKEEHPL